MHTLSAPSVAPELGVRASHTSPVILATDGETQSDAALVVARLFAADPEALRVVSVMKPLPLIPEAPVVESRELMTRRRAELQREVIAQMTRVWGTLHEIEIREGDPAFSIARLAHQSNATMVVSGLGRHRLVDRMFGDETALRLVRVCDVPVFAAVEGITHAPARVVVACDFSETSLRAARLAIELATPSATIYLAHVAPRGRSRYEWEGWGTAYIADAGDALRKTREQLHVPKDMTIQNVVLQGDPATEILAFAASVNADLIATGSHGHSFIARMLVGSVATRIVRCSSCSVLTVPYAAAMTDIRTTVEPPAGRTYARANWSIELDAFTRRNAGRRGVLEVDDAELGAQAQAFDYPLLGAVYDKHDDRVDLMFGDEGMTGHRFSRSLGGIRSIDVMRDDEGRDLAIRFAHGAGQTLLTFSTER